MGVSKFAIVAPGNVAFMLCRLYRPIRGATKGSTRQVGVRRALLEAPAFLDLRD